MKTIKTITLALLLICTVTFAQKNNPVNKNNAVVSKNVNSNSNTATTDEITAEDAVDIECTVPATPSAINGTPVACFSYITTYSIAAVPNATSYSWSVLGGAIQSISADGRTMKVRFGHGGRSVSVRAKNSCGSSGARTLAVSVVDCLP